MTTDPSSEASHPSGRALEGPGAHEFFETDADVGVHAWGTSRAEAFAHAAEGVFALIVTPTAVATTETREARAQGASPEALLVNWLNECLYVHEIEGFAVQRVDVDTCADGVVHGTLWGEELDRDRHHPSPTTRTAMFDAVETTGTDAGWSVRVLLG